MTLPEHTTVALAQFLPVEGDRKANLNRAASLAARAAREGADLLLFPEMFTTGYSVEAVMRSLAEPLDGDSIRFLQAAAQEHGIALAGSFLERAPERRGNYNTAVFIDSRGEIRGAFRKIHLFDGEKAYISAGDRLVTVDYAGVRYGMLICFDLEFPEAARLYAERGVQVLLVPSANMEPYALAHRTFARARAMENHCFVAYCNQCGRSEYFHFTGESCLVSPLGEIIGALAGEEGLVSGELRLAEIARSKESFDYLAERRSFS